jgi:RHH-type proline utilization regulon transcriptional repressor/proline dehydrogenase/delta 1-pyrroline-5-carboxylate dehydrogenase
LVVQLAAVLAVRGRAVWPSRFADIHERLPEDVRERITIADDWSHEAVAFDAVLHHAEQVARIEVLRRVAAKPGPIVAVSCLDPGDTAVLLDRLVVERSASVNTAAAGGNASLMAVG